MVDDWVTLRDFKPRKLWFIEAVEEPIPVIASAAWQSLLLLQSLYLSQWQANALVYRLFTARMGHSILDCRTGF